MSRLLYGKDPLERIVSIEVGDDSVEIFTEQEDGSVKSEFRDFNHWFLCSVPLRNSAKRLKGSLHYSYLHEFDSLEEYEWTSKLCWKKRKDFQQIYNVKERAMLRSGLSYFKGMKHGDVSVLSFDIETTGLKHDENSFVIIISNTLRKGGKTIKKMFSYDEYESQGDMLKAWCDWVRDVDPSVICGHNIFCYDIPYLQFIADNEGVQLNLGRDGSKINYSQRDRKFRKDASMFIHYYQAFIYGREVVDTLFLAYKYDVATRKYINYGLKNIISQEGLEKEDRQHYDAGTIRNNYKDPVEWEKIKKYAYDDADDSLALYDLMAPSLFYLTQSVPKPFQEVVCSATGSQVNSVMMRAYLQEGWSVPKSSPKKSYEGAISRGNSGIYRNVFKVDVASLYPSIMIWAEVYDDEKDPNAYFLKIVKEFTKQRLKHKQLGKTDKYYKDRSDSEKIFINSCYGFLGSGTSNFNCPEGAAHITKTGRDILLMAIEWAEKKGFKLVNCDTDSISFCRKDEQPIDEEKRNELVEDINKLYPDEIKWEDDGYYATFIVIKAKNYIMHDPLAKNEKDRLKYKGSAVKATTKEKALQQFIKDILNAILDGRENYAEIYENYVKEIMDITDITRWASKKTITEKVLKPKRTNEIKVLEAIKGKDFSEGDKAYFFFRSDKSLCLVEDFDGDYDYVRMLKKLYDTAKMFSTILPIDDLFPKYYTKKLQPKLQELLTNGSDTDMLRTGV